MGLSVGLRYRGGHGCVPNQGSLEVWRELGVDQWENRRPLGGPRRRKEGGNRRQKEDRGQSHAPQRGNGEPGNRKAEEEGRLTGAI